MGGEIENDQSLLSVFCRGKLVHECYDNKLIQKTNRMTD